MDKNQYTLIKSATKLMYPVFLAILILLLAGLTALAQDMPTESNSDALLVTHRQGPTNPHELEAFIDGVRK